MICLDVKEKQAMEEISWNIALDNANLNILCMEALSTSIRKKISLYQVERAFVAQEVNNEMTDIIKNKRKKRIVNFDDFRSGLRTKSKKTTFQASSYLSRNAKSPNFEMSPRSKKIKELEDELLQLKNDTVAMRM